MADLAAEALAPLLADPAAPFERPDAVVLKHSRSSAVVEFDLPGPDGPRRVVYKRFAVTKWSDPWTALVRPAPALRSYIMGHALLLRCLPTPRPLAVWHHYRCGLPHEGYLLTEKVADPLELLDFVDHLDTLPATERRPQLRRLIDRVAHLVGTLHQRRLSHRDLKAANLLVSGVSALAAGDEPQVCLIDLVGVRRPMKLRRSRRVQNLARLNTSFLDHPGLTRTDRLRFLRVYLHWGLRGRIGWKRWWRQIEEATANKVRTQSAPRTAPGLTGQGWEGSIDNGRAGRRTFAGEALPLAADLVESVGAQLELLAQAPQDGGFVFVGRLLKGAGDIIGAFALRAVIDEVVLRQEGAETVERFGIDAGPEQREIADVPVDLAARAAFGWHGLGLDHHLGDFLQPSAPRTGQPVDGVHVDEARKQGGEIVGQAGVGDP